MTFLSVSLIAVRLHSFAYRNSQAPSRLVVAPALLCLLVSPPLNAVLAPRPRTVGAAFTTMVVKGVFVSAALWLLHPSRRTFHVGD